ncbi:uncharacterized protein PHACADRAFT_180989 [Phanerochaete carnosa HHB-10118-sp]|uniref:F-box domain-containing protein n=1 Tax=Phanerochaete carnosa (strain HHB-10118-sp) TaxID=650164 RepID=K5WIL0_PHACS|nr:uncharacterized protein PHACADRAFT_180989 [Phanerochaete carnosa HHB-10118-sp]EKM58944.1 hypothetical protein PHACADRAFT_180989 [Phanerochaete carnosa HHB-10118-sp]
MHRCLREHEILREIIANVPSVKPQMLDGFIGYYWRDKISKSERPTYAALARVCRAFCEPATDALWRTIHVESLKRFFATLPDASDAALQRTSVRIAVDDTSQAYHSPGELHWARFLRNTARLHTIRVNNPRMATLFPNLRTLEVYSLSWELAACLPIFLSASVVECHITSSTEDPVEVDTLVSQLVRLCPNLQVLSGHTRAFTSETTFLLLGLQNLTSVVCEDGLPPSTAIHLSQKPQLCSLRVTTLVDLTAVFVSIETATRMLHLIEPTSLRELSLRLDGESESHALANLLHAVSRHSTLSRLELSGDPLVSGPPVPLLSIGQLDRLERPRVFILGVAVTKDDIPALCRTLPSLKKLYISRSRCSSASEDIRLPLDVLDLFARYMPRLESLKLDLKSLSLRGTEPPRNRSTRHIVLTFHHNVIEEGAKPGLVATYIAAIYPKCGFPAMGLTDMLIPDVDEKDPAARIDFWFKVNDLVPLFVRARADERQRFGSTGVTEQAEVSNHLS